MRSWPQVIQIQNITYNFYKSGNDAMDDTSNLGLASVHIPQLITKRFAKECGWNDGVIPHYDEDETNDAKSISLHDCYNADTQIVLMNWLFDKKRKYKLDYYGMDPFWLFHDALHAQNDVHSYEVCCINSYVEKQRLLDGAEYAFKNGITMTADTIIKIGRDWRSRWRSQEQNSMEKIEISEFYKFIDQHEIEIAEFWESDPEGYQSTGY